MRVALARDDIEVVAINDPFIDTKYMVYVIHFFSLSETLLLWLCLASKPGYLQAYMFKYDSTHGVYKEDIKVVDESTLKIGDHTIKVFGKRFVI